MAVEQVTASQGCIQLVADSLQWMVVFYTSTSIVLLSGMAWLLDKSTSGQLRKWHLIFVLLLIPMLSLLILAILLLKEINLQSMQTIVNLSSDNIQWYAKLNFNMFVASIVSFLISVIITVVARARTCAGALCLLVFVIIFLPIQLFASDSDIAKTEVPQEVLFVGESAAQLAKFPISNRYVYKSSESINDANVNLKYNERTNGVVNFSVWNKAKKKWYSIATLNGSVFFKGDLLQTSSSSLNIMDTVIDKSKIIAACEYPVQVVIQLTKTTPEAIVYFDDLRLGLVDSVGRFRQPTNACKGKTSNMLIAKRYCEKYKEEIAIPRNDYLIPRSITLSCK